MKKSPFYLSNYLSSNRYSMFVVMTVFMVMHAPLQNHCADARLGIRQTNVLTNSSNVAINSRPILPTVVRA